MNSNFPILAKRSVRGFNLIEVTVALAVISFSCTCLLGLLPASMSAFHQAMGNTIESEIVQTVSNDLALDNFSTLASYATTPTTSPTFYFDNEGQQLSSSAGYYYSAKLTFTQVTNQNSPANLDPASSSIGAYNVSVSVSTSATPAQAHNYSFVIANNGL